MQHSTGMDARRLGTDLLLPSTLDGTGNRTQLKDEEWLAAKGLRCHRGSAVSYMAERRRPASKKDRNQDRCKDHTDRKARRVRRVRKARRARRARSRAHRMAEESRERSGRRCKGYCKVSKPGYCSLAYCIRSTGFCVLDQKSGPTCLSLET